MKNKLNSSNKKYNKPYTTESKVKSMQQRERQRFRNRKTKIFVMTYSAFARPLKMLNKISIDTQSITILVLNISYNQYTAFQMEIRNNNNHNRSIFLEKHKHTWDQIPHSV